MLFDLGFAKENLTTPETFETHRGLMTPMSGYQRQADPASIVTPGALGLPGTPSFYGAFKVFAAMGNEPRNVLNARISGNGGYSFNQLFSQAAYGEQFNKDQIY